jgi:hypothetical protein
MLWMHVVSQASAKRIAGRMVVSRAPASTWLLRTG